MSWVATRYDRLAANYLAFIQLASIRLWLRRPRASPGHLRRRTHVRLRIGCVFRLMVEFAADRVQAIDDFLIDDVRRNAACHLCQVSELLSGSHNQIPYATPQLINLIRMGAFNLFLHSVASAADISTRRAQAGCSIVTCSAEQSRRHRQPLETTTFVELRRSRRERLRRWRSFSVEPVTDLNLRMARPIGN
jgi:hypothetical protein